MQDIFARRALFLAVVAGGLSGCAQFGKEPDRIDVRSQPAGAEIFVMGERVGVTPLAVGLNAVFPAVYAPEKRALYGNIELRKAGCKNSVNAVNTRAVAKGIDVNLECEGMAGVASHGGNAAASGDAPAKAGIEARLRQLRELREKGLISEQEEREARQRILHEL